MKLNRVHIKNFRSIKNVTIDFEPKCRVLVGINESGKTNILTALSHLDSTTKIDINDQRELDPDEPPLREAFVRFIFSLDESDYKAAISELEKKIIGYSKSASVIKIKGVPLTIEEFVRSRKEVLFRVELIEQSKSFSYWTLNEACEMLGCLFGVKTMHPPVAGQAPSKSVISTVMAKSYEAKTGEIAAELTLDSFNRLVCEAFRSNFEKKVPKVVFWKYSDAHLLPGKISISEFASDPDRYKPLMHMFHLAGYSDIAAEIEAAEERANGYRNLFKKVSTAATKHLHQVWKDYRGIKLEIVQNGEFIDAHIVDKYNYYDLSRRSDGFKRFVSFLLHVSTTVKTKRLQNALYLDDEPDNGLHPSGARYLREELIKVSEENYVVYATHSIFMIDEKCLERHLIVRKKDEETSVEVATDSNFADEEVIFNALGYSIFEHLRQSNLILEGWRDRQLFNVAMASSSSATKEVRQQYRDIGVCYCKGVKDVSRVSAMLELARRNCLIVSDADKPAKEHQKLYSGPFKWLRYDEIEASSAIVTGEDFVKYEAFKPILNMIRKDYPALGEIPTEPDFARSALGAIGRWLSKEKIEAEEQKRVIDRIKNEVFNTLKATSIRDEYWTFLRGLRRYLSE